MMMMKMKMKIIINILCKQPPSVVLKHWILPDNQSTVDVFQNRDLLTNITDTGKQMRLHWNAGITTTTHMGDLLESPHDGYYTVFMRYQNLDLFPHFSNHTFCTLSFVHTLSESSRTIYRFAPLNISVALFFIYCIATESSKTPYRFVPLNTSVVLGISFIVLLVVEEDWFTILLNTLPVMIRLASGTKRLGVGSKSLPTSCQTLDSKKNHVLNI